MGPINLQQGRITNRGGASGSSIQRQDQEQALRSQIQSEIERKAKFCANTQYECTLPRVDSYAYCFRHILQDPNAPYKQCEYVFSNGRRCLEPSPKYDAKKDYGTNYCFEHSRQTQLSKTKSTIGKLVPVETTETLLNSLAHHVKVDKKQQHYLGSNTPLKITVHEDDEDTDVDIVTPSVDPFVDVDVTAVNDSGRVVLDYASDSSSDDEPVYHPTYGTSWKGHEMDNSDNESVDSQGDDPLKHAGIYTAEEVTRITKDKLSRLQSLYIDQIHHLQHVLRERRRSYLKEQRAERDVHCSIYDQVKETPRERMLYEKLKGLNRYHRKHGVEAILQRKYLEKRAKATEGLQHKPPSLPKCSYTEGGVKCGERTLPCCKHCRKHILEDKKQVLFRACSIDKNGVVCQEPLAGLFDNITCPLHMELPAQRSFNKRKYESESEGECELSSIDANKANAGQEVNANIKQELHDVEISDLKQSTKIDGRRRTIRQDSAILTPTRVRNTRASKAAMAKLDGQQQQTRTSIVLSEDRSIKKEKLEPHEPEQNLTIVHDTSNSTISVATGVCLDPSGKRPEVDLGDLEEALLPVSIIAKNKPKQEYLDTELGLAKEQPEPMDTTQSVSQYTATVEHEEFAKNTIANEQKAISSELIKPVIEGKQMIIEETFENSIEVEQQNKQECTNEDILDEILNNPACEEIDTNKLDQKEYLKMSKETVPLKHQKQRPVLDALESLRKSSDKKEPLINTKAMAIDPHKEMSTAFDDSEGTNVTQIKNSKLESVSVTAGTSRNSELKLRRQQK
ncbi:uncharacterized protein LOC128725079 [Anopheles nili]|uniref:uncharacterized protein LOC128725079 n=1 Tax=Anopheles nili TaxID=185578 RepID=UPI00237B31F3|nr:uncharacterized protein LOC128725079 [Anopheles nili]